MAFTQIPQAISAALLGLTNNYVIILLIMERHPFNRRNLYGCNTGNLNLYAVIPAHRQNLWHEPDSVRTDSGL